MSGDSQKGALASETLVKGAAGPQGTAIGQNQSAASGLGRDPAGGGGRGVEKPGSPSLGEQLAAPTSIGKGLAAPGRSRCAPGGMSGLSEDTRVRDAGAPSPRGGSTQAGWPWWASWATGGCWQRGGLTSGRGTYPQVRETRTRRRECSVTRGFKHGQKYAVAAAAHLCPHPCNCT